MDAEPGQAYDFLLKMIIIGASGTGKTCLLHHFIHDEPKDGAAHTIGVEFASRILRVGSKGVKLQLWDTAGQERFFSVVKNYYRGASACLLVFDITQCSSFDSLDRWLTDARQLASPDLVTIVVGNKLDRQEERQVGHVEASRWAAERGVVYVETSSLDGKNVEQPFLVACQTILQGIEAGKIVPEMPGSGISYGDRGLRRVGRGGGNNGRGGIPTSESGRFNFADLASGSGQRGTVTLQQRMSSRFDGCC